LYDIIKKEFIKLIKEKRLQGERVIIRATPLSPKEAIGNPEDRDYPLVVGVERLMQAEFRGALGQAYTDMYGDFSGTLSEIMGMDLKNNFRRAILIASLNAVMRRLGLITRTVHCKDDQPRECSYELVRYIEKNYGQPKVAMAGFQPRMVEALAKHFELRVTDMDRDNIGKEKFGAKIFDPSHTGENLNWCDIALVTGSTVVNNTIAQFRISKPVIFYGVSISGAAKLLGLSHFCPFGG
jgi:hypothetical protein